MLTLVCKVTGPQRAKLQERLTYMRKEKKQTMHFCRANLTTQYQEFWLDCCLNLKKITAGLKCESQCPASVPQQVHPYNVTSFQSCSSDKSVPGNTPEGSGYTSVCTSQSRLGLFIQKNTFRRLKAVICHPAHVDISLVLLLATARVQTLLFSAFNMQKLPVSELHKEQGWAG